MPLHQFHLQDHELLGSLQLTLDPKVNIFIGPSSAGKSRLLQEIAQQAEAAVNSGAQEAPRWLRRHFVHLLSPEETLQSALADTAQLPAPTQIAAIARTAQMLSLTMPDGGISELAFIPETDSDRTPRLTCKEYGHARDATQLGAAAQKLLALGLSLTCAAAARQPDNVDPAQSPGLLVAEELDASLHPRSQNRLLPAFTQVFPQLQIFATVHSDLPLMGLEPGQLHQVARDPGTRQVTVTTNNERIGGGWSPNDILRQFHGIAHPTDLETEAAARDYLEREAAAGDNPDPEVQAALEAERRQFTPEVLYNSGEHQVREMQRILRQARQAQQNGKAAG